MLLRSSYRSFKQKLIEIYLIISFVGEVVLKDSQLYIYSLMTISCLLLTDAFISIVALRFWGKYSFSNYHWYNIINFIISFVIIANAIKYQFYYSVLFSTVPFSESAESSSSLLSISGSRKLIDLLSTFSESFIEFCSFSFFFGSSFHCAAWLRVSKNMQEIKMNISTSH